MSLFSSLIESSIRHLSGGIGRKLRYHYYKRRLAFCGKEVVIDEGVYFSNPDDIFIDNNVWIDKHCILIAGQAKQSVKVKKINNPDFKKEAGQIHIGHHSHLGIGSILQGHGGIHIEEYFTTSAGCKLYSFSNDYSTCEKGTVGKEAIHYISSPIRIGKNVWLGLNVCVIGNTIKDNCFVHANGVVSANIEENCIAKGAPAMSFKKRF